MFGDMINEINDIRGNFSDAQLERMKQEWKNKPASALTHGVKQMIMKMDAPTRAALENAKINHISKFAGSTFKESNEQPVQDKQICLNHKLKWFTKQQIKCLKKILLNDMVKTVIVLDLQQQLIWSKRN